MAMGSGRQKIKLRAEKGTVSFGNLIAMKVMLMAVTLLMSATTTIRQSHWILLMYSCCKMLWRNLPSVKPENFNSLKTKVQETARDRFLQCKCLYGKFHRRIQHVFTPHKRVHDSLSWTVQSFWPFGQLVVVTPPLKGLQHCHCHFPFLPFPFRYNTVKKKRWAAKEFSLLWGKQK